jgi:hypothetical protein
LANVFQGFGNIFEIPKSAGESLQDAMAEISKLPENERAAAAREVFARLGTDEAEQQPWLEALTA